MTETERARPTINDGLRLLRKIELCESDAAKLILLRDFCEAYASERVAGLKRFAFHRFDCEADGNIHHSNAYRWRDGDEKTCTCGLAGALGLE